MVPSVGKQLETVPISETLEFKSVQEPAVMCMGNWGRSVEKSSRGLGYSSECVCVRVIRRMPRWADPGNLGSKEKLGREFGSGVLRSWGLWVSLKSSCPGRNRCRSLELWTKHEAVSIFSCSRQREKGVEADFGRLQTLGLVGEEKLIKCCGIE